jgi:DNA primase
MDEGLLDQFLRELGSRKVIRTNDSNLSASCPFAQWNHPDGSDSNPSFSISITEPSRWRCFSCGQKGVTIRSLCGQIISYGGLGALSQVAHRWMDAEKGSAPKGGYGLQIFKNDLEKPRWTWHSSQQKEETKFDWDAFAPLTHLLAPYAIERGIPPEQYARWKLGWDKPNNKLFIPIFDEFQIFRGYSMRAIPPFPKETPKYKHAKGFVKDNYLFGECFLDKAQRTGIFVEGFMDVWALEKQGFANVFATMGTSVSDRQLQKIHHWFDSVIIIPDNDKRNEKTGIAPGERAARDLEAKVKEMGKKVIVSPVLTGKKDVGEWTRREICFVLNKISEGHSINLPIRPPAKG